MARNNRGSGRRSTPSTRGDRRSSSQEPPQAPPEGKLSDPQEIAELPRREGRVWHAVEVDRVARNFRELAKDADEDAGLRAWRLGDLAFELYNGFPERAKGVATFMGFATVALEKSERDIREFLRIRHRVPNAEVAKAYGRGRIGLAFRLMHRLAIDTFEALSEKDLLLPDGTTCRFPATVPKLRAALKLLGKRNIPKTSRKLQAEAVRYNEAHKLGKEDDPDLQIRGEFLAHDGEVKFAAKEPMSTAQCLALARFLEKLRDDED